MSIWSSARLPPVQVLRVSRLKELTHIYSLPHTFQANLRPSSSIPQGEILRPSLRPVPCPH